MAPPARKPSLSWFRTDVELPTNRKIRKLRVTAHWSRYEAIGRVVELFAWYAKHCPGGVAEGDDLTSLFYEMQTRAMEVAGDPLMNHEDRGSSRRSRHNYLWPFVESGFLIPLTRVGAHLEPDEEPDPEVEFPEDPGDMSDAYELHDWWDMNGSHVREVAKDRERKLRNGNGSVGGSAGPPPVVPPGLRMLDVDVDVRQRQESKSKDLSPEGDVSGFDSLWKLYPHYGKRSSKAKSLQRWKSLNPKPPIREVIRGLEECKESEDWIREGGRFVPALEVWIGKRGWDASDGRQGGEVDSEAELRSRLVRAEIRRLEEQNGTL
jgi:hypothetical protein